MYRLTEHIQSTNLYEYLYQVILRYSLWMGQSLFSIQLLLQLQLKIYPEKGFLVKVHTGIDSDD